MDLPERAYRLSNMLPAWNKSGLYAEFKSKVKLYLECLGYYLDGRDGTGFLAVEPLGWDNIQRFLEEGPIRTRRQRGCFAVSLCASWSACHAKLAISSLSAGKPLRRPLPVFLPAQAVLLTLNVISRRRQVPLPLDKLDLKVHHIPLAE
jgi:hypothetical protein